MATSTEVMLGLVLPGDRRTVVTVFQRSRAGQEVCEGVRVTLPDGAVRHLTLAVRA
jgi:hypothetical protein